MNEKRIIVAIISNGIIKEFTETFDEDLSIFDALDYALNYDAFRIPEKEGRDLWNTIINRDWDALDEEDYIYDKPICKTDEWVIEKDTAFYSVKELDKN